MNSTVDLLTVIGAHLAAFELPPIASIHIHASPPGPPVTVQLHHRGPTALAQGLLAWADTLTDITTEAWRVPEGDSVHLSVTGLLAGGTAVQVYGGMRVTDRGLGADLASNATRTLPLATLRHLSTPGQTLEEVAL
jgi:hypothetical protein